MIYLREMVKKQGVPAHTSYPLSAQVLQSFEKLSFSHSVTILCGENGSGKTTLMELLCAGVNATLIGDSGVHGEKARLFKTSARQFRFVMNQHPQRSFYFTAEDFSRYLDQRRRMAQEAREDLKRLDEDYQGRSALARSLAAQPFERTLGEMQGQAALLEVEQGGIWEVSYDGLSSIQFFKHFMAHREGILRRSGIEGGV